MPAAVDLSPYGTHPPGPLPQAVLAVTRGLPANWLGLRLSMPLRRMAINALGDRPIDTTLWNARVRLYPSRNSCEKNALFTPQMFDLHERSVLAAALDRRLAAGESFTFVDIGANVGLYSLFVAARGGARARVLAIEPQPGILERLTYNREANPDLNIEIVPLCRRRPRRRDRASHRRARQRRHAAQKRQRGTPWRRDRARALPAAGQPSCATPGSLRSTR